jgi:hypothetical protein
VKSNPAEYLPIIVKLLEKTRAGKVVWQPPSFGSISYDDHEVFTTRVGSEQEDSVSFTITAYRNNSSLRRLSMNDSAGNEIFLVTTNDLPTSSEEEEMSLMLDELYGLARRQAFKVEQKIDLASALLDRV